MQLARLHPGIMRSAKWTRSSERLRVICSAGQFPTLPARIAKRSLLPARRLRVFWGAASLNGLSTASHDEAPMAHRTLKGLNSREWARMSVSNPNRKTPKWMVGLCLVFPPLILIVVSLALLLFVISTVSLHILIWSWWCLLRGRDTLLVYSDSPVWHDYVEQHIIPQLGKRAVILNWSERRSWRFSIAKMAFYYFGGYRQFNPLGVVFRPFQRSRVFRFWLPFGDFKHGEPEALHKMENDFFSLCGNNRLKHSLT